LVSFGSVFQRLRRVYNVGLPLNMQEGASAAELNGPPRFRNGIIDVEGNAMSQADPMTVIAQLQRARRRWRTLALSLLALAVALFLIVALITVVGWGRARAEQMRALEAMARAEQAREEASRAKQERIRTAGSRGHDEATATPENSVITLDVVLEEVDLAANTVSAMATTYVVPPHGQVGGAVFSLGTLDTPDKDKTTRLVRLPVMPVANIKEKGLQAGAHAVLRIGVSRQGALVVVGINKFNGLERIWVDGLDAPGTEDKK
jgi:type II secretory pathway pseudopilin PulG